MSVSPSTSDPANVNIVASAATVSRTSTAASVPRIGASFTALTTKEIELDSVTVPSEILSTRSPTLPRSVFTSALGVKTIPSRFSTVKVSPAVIRVPSAKANVPPVGKVSTVMVKVSPSTSITETEKAAAVSSVKEKELAAKDGASLIAVTVKEMLDVLDEEPSLADKTRLPKLFKSEFAFSSDANEILESCAEVNSVPAASKTPSDVVSVKPVGTEVTVIVRVPEALLGCDIEKVPGVSSSKVKD